MEDVRSSPGKRHKGAKGRHKRSRLGSEQTSDPKGHVTSPKGRTFQAQHAPDIEKNQNIVEVVLQEAGDGDQADRTPQGKHNRGAAQDNHLVEPIARSEVTGQGIR